MNDDDHFRVSQVTTVGAGRLPKRMWEWLEPLTAVKKSRPDHIKVDVKKMFN